MRGHPILWMLAVVFATGCAKQADLLKLQRQETEARALLADTRLAVDRAEREIGELRARLADGRAASGGRAVADVEARLARIEARVSAMESGGVLNAGGLGGAAVKAAAMIPGTAAAPLALRAETGVQPPPPNAYQAALELYKQEQWDEAITRFKDFVQSSSRSAWADNAQYWIGESYYNQRDYNRAIIELNEVLLKYPEGDRVPGALLALATAFADSGDPVDARLILQKLISDHPASPEAAIGRDKLQGLRN